jgi:hypothetical protein
MFLQTAFHVDGAGIAGIDSAYMGVDVRGDEGLSSARLPYRIDGVEIRDCAAGASCVVNH